jgi:hypothetical protein
MYRIALMGFKPANCSSQFRSKWLSATNACAEEQREYVPKGWRDSLMGQNLMRKCGRIKISLADQGSPFPVGGAKRRTTIGELYLPRVLEASYAMAQMPTRPPSYSCG